MAEVAASATLEARVVVLPEAVALEARVVVLPEAVALTTQGQTTQWEWLRFWTRLHRD